MNGTGHKKANNAVSRKIAAISIVLLKNKVEFKKEKAVIIA